MKLTCQTNFAHFLLILYKQYLVNQIIVQGHFAFCIHHDTGPPEGYQFWWGQAGMVGIIYPLRLE